MHTKKDTKNQRIIDSYDYMANAASPMDCTGLIPSKPVSKAEIESYEDLYHFTPPAVPDKKNSDDISDDNKKLR